MLHKLHSVMSIQEANEILGCIKGGTDFPPSSSFLTLLLQVMLLTIPFSWDTFFSLGSVTVFSRAFPYLSVHSVSCSLTLGVSTGSILDPLLLSLLVTSLVLTSLTVILMNIIHRSTYAVPASSPRFRPVPPTIY